MTELRAKSASQGNLDVRLAQSAEDLAAVQRLRWQVFHEEMGATAATGVSTHLDSDVYDPLCDHLLVIDTDRDHNERVVGTYRLLRESVAKRSFGFYSAVEFDIEPLQHGPNRPRGELLELGRSCVLPPFRTSGTISLLWRGIADYIASHDIGLMFGCGSFPGIDPAPHAAALSWLYHKHLADAAQRPRVHADSGIAMERLPRGSYDERRALLDLPPLLKGYLRAGARFGDGAFVDFEFNTIDVCVVLPVEAISERYAARFNTSAA